MESLLKNFSVKKRLSVAAAAHSKSMAVNQSRESSGKKPNRITLNKANIKLAKPNASAGLKISNSKDIACLSVSSQQQS